MRRPFIAIVSASIATVSVGCAEDDVPPPPAESDSSVDSYWIPDGDYPDNPPFPLDTPPPRCDRALPADFRCTPGSAKAGQTVCTEEMIQELARTCSGLAAGSADCMTTRAKFPDCALCALNTWVYGPSPRVLDTGACMTKLDPTSNCGTSWKCEVDCVESVCGECYDSEREDCRTRARSAGGSGVMAGACHDIATKEVELCRLNPFVLACFVDKTEDVVRFLRGACRDGGDWSKSGM